MIKQKDVILLKIPFPTISDKLASQAHMYICIKTELKQYSFVKCQTLKPIHLIKQVVKNFITEQPDKNRNPFIKPTLIDCDKVFLVPSNSLYNPIRTNIRTDVCDEVINQINHSLNQCNYKRVALDENELKNINQPTTSKTFTNSKN